MWKNKYLSAFKTFSDISISNTLLVGCYNGLKVKILNGIITYIIEENYIIYSIKPQVKSQNKFE